MNRPFYEPGYYPDLSNDEYHGSFGYGSTTLKTLSSKTMEHLEYERSQPDKDTDATKKGQLLHSMILEPHKVETEFLVRPEGLSKPSDRIRYAKKPSAESKRKIAAWEDFEEELGNRIDITHEAYQHCDSMSDSVRNHPIMGSWFDGSISGMSEQSIYYWYRSEDWDEKNDYKTMLKVRPDWVLKGHNVIFDVKTARDASFSGFMKQAKQLNYHMSAAMYLDGCNRNRDFLDAVGVIAFIKFVWVVVENEPPYCSTFYEISQEDLEEGRHMYHKLVRKLDRYNRSDWKGYGDADQDGFITPEGRLSDLPKWGNNIV